jgi:hypothetical protein
MLHSSIFVLCFFSEANSTFLLQPLSRVLAANTWCQPPFFYVQDVRYAVVTGMSWSGECTGYTVWQGFLQKISCTSHIHVGLRGDRDVMERRMYRMYGMAGISPENLLHFPHPCGLPRRQGGDSRNYSAIGSLPILMRHSFGPLSCTDSPRLSTATVTGISLTSNSRIASIPRSSNATMRDALIAFATR